MNSIKIFLAVLMIMLASNVLSGCDASPQVDAPEVASFSQLTASERSNLSQLAMARMDVAKALEKSVTLKMEVISNAEDRLHVQLLLENPKQTPITSVESWVSYSPKQLKGMRMEVDEELFELIAPYENGFDDDNGLLKFGRSTATPLTDERVVLAELWFEKATSDAAILDAYDYQYDLSGHQSVNMMHEGEPVNMLLKPHTPLLVVR